MKKKILLIPLALLLAISLVATGCPAAPPVKPPPPTPPAPPTLPQPQYGGVLKITWPYGLRILGYPPEVAGADWWSVQACIENLVRTDENGLIVPWLATDWEIAPDSKSITFTLREGVKFHDGTDFNAEAVKYNVDLQIAAKKAGFMQVTSVDVVDNYTVRFNLSQWSNALLYTLAQWDGMMASPAAIKTNGVEWARGHPVGTGPFKFVSFTPDVALKYERFDGYWQKGKPYLDRLEYIYINDVMTAVASFQAGEIDLLWGDTPKVLTDLQAKGYKVDATPATLYVLIGDNANPNSVFANQKVREAIEYAIDKEAITKAIGYGIWKVLDQPCSRVSFAYNPDVKGHPYDPNKARKLLAEAGYPDGFKTKLVQSPFSSKDATEAVQGFLSKVGIDAQIEVVDIGAWATIMADGEKDALILTCMTQSAGNYGRNLVADFPPDYSILPSTLRPPGFADLLERALAATDEHTMVALNQELVKLLADNETWIPLYEDEVFAATKPEYVHADIATYDMLTWHPENAWLSK